MKREKRACATMDVFWPVGPHAATVVVQNGVVRRGQPVCRVVVRFPRDYKPEDVRSTGNQVLKKVEIDPGLPIVFEGRSNRGVPRVAWTRR